MGQLYPNGIPYEIMSPEERELARQTNERHIAAVAASDPEPAATLNAELDRAFAPTPPS